MKRLIYTLALFLIFACTRTNNIKLRLSEISDIIQEKPDLALMELEAIDSSNLSGIREKAKYSLLLTMARDKNYIIQTDPDVLSPALRYYRRDGKDKALTLFYYGVVLYNAKGYYDALQSFLQASELLEKTDCNSKYNGMTLSYIGLTYNACHNKTEELLFAEKAYQKYKEIGDTAHFQVALLNLAMAYNNNRRYKEADSILVDICRGSDSYDYTTEAALLLRNDINLRSDSPDAKMSLKILEDVRDKGHGWGMEEACQYAYALFLDGQTGKSFQAERALVAKGAEENLDALFVLYRLSKKRGEMSVALERKEKIDSLKDKYIVQMLEQSLFKAQTENALIKEKEAEHRLFSYKLILIITILLLGLLVVIAIDILRQYKQKYLLEKEKLIAAKEKTETWQKQLETNNREYVLAIRPVFKEIENFFLVRSDVAIEQMKRDRVLRMSREYDKLVDELNDRGFELFEKKLNDHMGGIMTSLRVNCPKLKERDCRLLGYVFAGFKDSTIATLLHMNHSSMRSQKSRLKDRLARLPQEISSLYMPFL